MSVHAASSRLAYSRRCICHLQSFFAEKPALEKGTTITLLWEVNGTLGLKLSPNDEGMDYSRVRIPCQLSSARLCGRLRNNLCELNSLHPSLAWILTSTGPTFI